MPRSKILLKVKESWGPERGSVVESMSWGSNSDLGGVAAFPH